LGRVEGTLCVSISDRPGGDFDIDVGWIRVDLAWIQLNLIPAVEWMTDGFTILDSEQAALLTVDI
jgi:hypothetical protein